MAWTRVASRALEPRGGPGASAAIDKCAPGATLTTMSERPKLVVRTLVLKALAGALGGGALLGVGVLYSRIGGT